MKKYLKKLLPIIVTLSMILSSCGAKAEVSEEPILTPVETTTIVSNNITKDLTYAGQIKPADSVTITSKLSGTVTDTYKEIGDSVSANDPLFTIDKKDVENQIKQLEAQQNVANQGVKTAQNSLNNVTGSRMQSSLIQMEAGIENTKKQIESATIALNSANENLLIAKTNFDNAQVLHDAGTMSKNDYILAANGLTQAKAAVETSQNAIDTANTSLKQQEDSYNLEKTSSVSENKTSAALGVNQAQASANSTAVQLQIARQSLNDTTTRSPISGIVSVKGAVKGQIISPTVPAYTIVNMDFVQVEVKVSEVLINTLKLGEDVDISINAITDNMSKEPIKLVGKITEINPVADQTSTYPIKITLDNSDHKIKPGMFATVTFETEKSENTIILPHEVVITNGTDKYVFVEKDGIAYQQIVETGLDNGKDIEIVSGLKVGDKVISSGQTYISDEEKVNVVNNPPSENASGGDVTGNTATTGEKPASSEKEDKGE